jgi:hypothetical protein
VVLGDNPASAIADIQQAKENMFPVIFLQGSPLTDDVIASKGGFPKTEEEIKAEEEAKEKGEAPPPAEAEEPKADGKIEDPTLKEFVDEGKFLICKSNSEDIANITHLALTVTLLDLKKPETAPEAGDQPPVA